MILDNKQKDFLNILLKEEDPVSIEMLQKQLNTSRRTIYYLVNKINEILMDNHFEPLQNKRGHGYFIEINEKQKIHEMINDEDEMEFLKPKERVYYLICWLLYPQSVVHVETMMNQFDISRNSVFNDLKNVKDELENYDLEINFDNKKGYFIDGKTFSKRAVLLYYLKLLLMKLHYRNLHFLNSSDVEDFYQRLIRISSELGNEYDGENLLSIACLLCIVRFTNERFEFSLLELRDLGETEELQLIDNYFQDFNVHERLYLAVHLLGSKAGNALKVKDNEDDISLFELAQRMCDTFERLACVKLADKNDLVNSLYIHFKLSMYYYKLSIQVVNPLMKEVKENYYDLYQMVKHMCNELSDELPFPVLDSEIVYITMHFGGHLHNGAGNFYRKVRVLVVCPSGISTSTLLRREIEQLYSNVTVVASATANNIWEYEDDIDFIVSTINLKTEVPWIKVNAILSNEDKSRIASMMMLSFNTYTMDDKQMNGLVHLIEKYVPEDKIDALKNDLVKYLQKGNVLVKVEEQDKTRILDALSVENIQICDEEFYWKDAVVKASQTLLAQNVIKEKYIQAMIELLEDYGPYIVLQNKVAIAHASPSQGANTFGLALLVNRKDILFEDSKVKYLFVLSNPDQEKHLHLMRDIMYLSSQKEMLDEIDDMKDAESILRKLTEVTRNMQNEF